MEQLPRTVEELIIGLDKEYPSRCPNIQMSDRQIWVEVGKREIVEKLLLLLEEDRQQEGDSTGVINV